MRFGFAALAVLSVSLFSFAASAQEGKLTPEQKEEIRGVVRDYLTTDPTVTKDALSALQQYMEAEASTRLKAVVKENTDAIYNSKLSPVGGNPSGDVTIVEFFDYNCGYCHMAAALVERLVREDPGVKIIYKQFPILSEDSSTAAKVALAVAKQGKYTEFHAAMMNKKPEESGSPSDPMAAATALGLDMEKIKTDSESAEVKAEIEQNYALAQKLGIRGTPAYIIGDTLTPGAISYAQMQELVAAARTKQEAKEAPAPTKMN